MFHFVQQNGLFYDYIYGPDDHDPLFVLLYNDSHIYVMSGNLFTVQSLCTLYLLSLLIIFALLNY